MLSISIVARRRMAAAGIVFAAGTGAADAARVFLPACSSNSPRYSTVSHHETACDGRVIVDFSHPSHLLEGPMAIGGALDGLDRGAVNRVYSAKNIAAMKSAGLGSVTYRLRTELGGESWHWNPEGSWSDPVHARGYWTSSAAPSSPIMLSYGYRLPRRGNTNDQANNDGYSRIDDGDPATYWKSNPYLDRRFAAENHPQWVFIDLGARKPIDAIRILWGSPYATAYRVDYWRPGVDGKWGGIENTLYEDGTWVPFRHGEVRGGRGGDTSLRLAGKPVLCQCIRLWMSRSSSDDSPGLRGLANVASSGPKSIGSSGDARERMGYAIREMGLGVMDRAGRLRDAMRHGRSAAAQSVIQTSSTDPWHTRAGRDGQVEQPGFDRVLASGLTRGLPALFPVGIVYDTPDNAAAEVKWLLAKHVPLRGVELGEEPDGQYMTPEDYGSLYLQFARELHRIAPNLAIGGPSYQTVSKENPCWPGISGDKSFTHRLVDYLRRHGALNELQFFSFECYTFDDVCGNPQHHLYALPSILDEARSRWIAEGVPAGIPWYISEMGYAPYAGEPEVDLAGAMADVEIIAKFLTLGGTAAYVYGYEPNTLMCERPQCNTWGNLAMWQTDDDYNSLHPFAAFYAVQLLTRRWTGGGAFHVYPANVIDNGLRPLPDVTAYASMRSDRRMALLLLNKDARRPRHVRLPSASGSTGHRINVLTYGQAQYRWHLGGEHGYASPDLPPHTSSQTSPLVTLPANSISVVEL